MADVVGAFGAERGVSGRVGAGLGEDVAAIAEGVNPCAEVERFVLGEAAEVPAGTHESADVCADRCRVDGVAGGERVVESGAGFAGSLGDVLGDVRGHGVVIGAVAVDAQGPGVDLGAPAECQFADGGGVGRVDLHAPGGGTYGVGEEFRGAPGRGFVGGSVRAVEADDGVDVDGRPFLVFGDAGEGEPGVLGEAGLYEAG